MRGKKAFIKAAKNIAENIDIFACCAISHAVLRCKSFKPTEERFQFEKVFQPHGTQIAYNGSWYGEHTNPENQNSRVLALLLMAETYEEGIYKDKM